ncbi:hypothetical protein XBLMG947_2689 [Xanthomonas bromi]|uniref:Uncharacterized protein n=1 Tax=Xanthomonas bromi TaxID=56449 RepID=A0A1C3NND5_9XANT|nr:hypothetical protein [Xanthomonas bromi]SBV51899.1 hypothetical protein XBLMG947_2689 [Xanthomonas bromi]
MAGLKLGARANVGGRGFVAISCATSATGQISSHIDSFRLEGRRNNGATKVIATLAIAPD